MWFGPTHSDGDHGSVRKRRHDDFLEDVLLQGNRPESTLLQSESVCCLRYRCHVDGRRGFIHDEDAALPDEGSGQTEELPLADAEVLSSFCHHSICTQIARLKPASGRAISLR